MIIAIDPGPTESAVVELDGMRIGLRVKLSNDTVRNYLAHHVSGPSDHLVIEMVASYGMPVGAEVFDTCVAVGRFVQAWGRPYTLLKRKTIVAHLCGSAKASDANVRRALLDRWGGVPTGKRPPKGHPLADVVGDVWSALAAACVWSDMTTKQEIRNAV